MSLLDKIPTSLIVLCNLILSTIFLKCFDIVFELHTLDSVSKAVTMTLFLILFFGGIIYNGGHLGESLRSMAITRFINTSLFTAIGIICLMF